MLRVIDLAESVCIGAPVASVWDALSRLEDIELWSEAVVSARCHGRSATGVGAERTCDLVGGITINERWLAWEEGVSFTYEGVGLPLVARATNTWSVRPEGTAETLLQTQAQVTLKGGLVGRLLEPLVAWKARRMGRRALAAFTYLVEHGMPPPFEHSRLPSIRVAC